MRPTNVVQLKKRADKMDRLIEASIRVLEKQSTDNLQDLRAALADILEEGNREKRKDTASTG